MLRPFDSSRTTRRHRKPCNRARRLLVEPLEARKLLATIQVTTTQDVVDPDDGLVSLREAVRLANDTTGDDTIDASGLKGTISLANAHLKITDDVTINGPGQNNLTIDAHQKSRIFNIEGDSIDVHVSGLTLTGGRTTRANVYVDNVTDYGQSGGAIRFMSKGKLTLRDSTVADSRTSGKSASGGGIFLHAGNLTLENSTVSGNRTSGEGSRGGGIYAFAGQLNFSNSHILGNRTTGEFADGGGLFTRDSDLTLTESSVIKNRTTGNNAEGGGIATQGGESGHRDLPGTTGIVLTMHSTQYCFLTNSDPLDGSCSEDEKPDPTPNRGQGAVNLVRSDVSGNSTQGNSSYGGGISTGHGYVSVDNSTISNNSTHGKSAAGGGIHTDSGKVTLTGSNLSGNNTQGDSSSGGGISAGYRTVSIRNSTVHGNYTVGRYAAGGAIDSFYNFVDVISSTVSDNHTSGRSSHGGAIDLSLGSILVMNSTVTGNATKGHFANGGGIHSFDSRTRIVNSTFTANRATGQGGGIDILNRNRQTLTIHNSIIAGNADDGTAPDFDSPKNPNNTSPKNKLDVRHSIIGNGTTGTGGAKVVHGKDGNIVGIDWKRVLENDGKNPLLKDHGGATKIIALVSNSPAINAGSNSLAKDADGELLRSDQRGFSVRRYGGRVDIGAFERFKLNADDLVVTSTADGLLLGDKAVTLRDAMFVANTTPGPQTINATGVNGKIKLRRGELDIFGGVTIRGPGDDNLTIDAQGNSRVINVPSGSFDVTISGVTITGGKTTSAAGHGAGINFGSRGTLELQDVTVSENATTGIRAYGAGIRSSSGNVVLTDSVVSANSTSGEKADGGGIRTSSGDVTLIRSVVADNETSGKTADGGGLYVKSGDVLLFRSRVVRNQAGGHLSKGGGIRTPDGNVTINQSTVARNSGNGIPQYASGIASGKSELQIVDRDLWRMGQPIVVDGKVIVTANNSVAGKYDSIEVVSNRPWTNFLRPGDVNNDGLVQASDALRIINELAKRQYSEDKKTELYEPSTMDAWPGIYFDRSGDGKVTALDALQIVNELAASLEGEQPALSAGTVAPPTPNRSTKASLQITTSFSLWESRALKPGRGQLTSPSPSATASDPPTSGRVLQSKGLDQNDSRGDATPIATDQLFSDEVLLGDLRDIAWQ